MRRLLTFGVLLGLMLITALTTIEYAYSAPSYATYDYQAMKIISIDMSSDELKADIETTSADNNTNIIYEERFREDLKDTYIFYSTLEADEFGHLPIDSKIEWKDFAKLDSYKLVNRLIYIENTSETDSVINELEELGIKLEPHQQLFDIFVEWRDVLPLVLLTLLLNIIIIFIYHNNMLKEYSIRILEGSSKLSIIGDEVVRKTSFYLAMVAIILFIIFIWSPLFYYFVRLSKFLLFYVVYLAIIHLVALCTCIKNEHNIYMKNYNNNDNFIFFLMMCKYFVFIGLAITIPSIVGLYEAKSDILDEIASLDKYSDIVVSEIYDSTGSITDDDVYSILEQFYLNTVDRYNGVLYGMETTGNSVINYNALSYIDIIDTEGNIITEDDMSTTISTVLVPESSVNDFNEDSYDRECEIKVIQDNQTFMSVVSWEITEKKMVHPQTIVYLPRNFTNLQYNDIVPQMTGREYFLNVPGEDKFKELEPVINESGGNGVIINAPSIAIASEEKLLNITNDIQNKMYLFTVFVITGILVSIFVVTMYIRSEGKDLAVKSLEGTSTVLNFKVIYAVIIIELITGLIMIAFNRTDFITLTSLIIFELLLNAIVIRHNTKDMLVGYLKGEK